MGRGGHAEKWEEAIPPFHWGSLSSPQEGSMVLGLEETQGEYRVS